MSPRHRSAKDELARADAALARALASGADPWRVQELRLRRDQLWELAADAPDAPPRRGGPPPPREAAEPLPLEWVDESGRSRRLAR